jgi:uroporphyrin-III C-methyltransferase/precorrin-2 dehydrogenase/sirohydrochlorin ferrochelatase
MAGTALHSLPVFVRLAGRPVILIGSGEAADAKRRLLERAGASIVGENAVAALAIVVDDEAAVARLRARGVLVNAVDQPELCDFTLPAIVDRAPVIVAIGTGGVSAGLAAALRQRLEALLPADLGRLAESLYAARDALRGRFPDGGDRRRALGAALAAGGPLDPFAQAHDVSAWLGGSEAARARVEQVTLTSPNPDDLTLRTARLLASADRVVHDHRVPPAILDRARADADRLPLPPPEDVPGLTVILQMA